MVNVVYTKKAVGASLSFFIALFSLFLLVSCSSQDVKKSQGVGESPISDRERVERFFRNIQQIKSKTAEELWLEYSKSHEKMKDLSAYCQLSLEDQKAQANNSMLLDAGWIRYTLALMCDKEFGEKHLMKLATSCSSDVSRFSDCYVDKVVQLREHKRPEGLLGLMVSMYGYSELGKILTGTKATKKERLRAFGELNSKLINLSLAFFEEKKEEFSKGKILRSLKALESPTIRTDDYEVQSVQLMQYSGQCKWLDALIKKNQKMGIKVPKSALHYSKNPCVLLKSRMPNIDPHRHNGEVLQR